LAKDKKALGSSTKGKASDNTGKGLIIGVAVVTLIAGASGFLFATQFLKQPDGAKMAEKSVSEKTPKSAPGSGHGDEHSEDQSSTGELVTLPPIVTNLQQPSETFIRIEGAILVEAGYADAKTLAALVSEDIIALLKATSLAEMQGTSGFQHLRDDIDDRVKVRSEGKAKRMILTSLVIE